MSDGPRDGWRRLFDPGERLGWEFRDRLGYWRHFQEPAPRPTVADPTLHAQLQRTIAQRQTALTWAAIGAVPGLLAAWYLAANLMPGGTPQPVLVVLATAVLAGALWLSAWRPLRLVQREHRLARDIRTLESTAVARTADANAGWRSRAEAHTAAEWDRVNRIAEWGAVRTAAGAGRTDVFGGTLRTWEGFVTTYGASLLSEAPPLRVLDLSEGLVAEELCELARARGLRVAAEVLPGQLAASGLLAGLDAAGLADVLVESIHGERSESGREARAIDARILGAVCAAVGPAPSLARVHEALLAAMGEPASRHHLSPEEWERAAGLFSADYVQGAHDRFRSLEAHLHPLRDLGSAAQPAPPGRVDLGCLSVGGDDEVFATDLFCDLAAQWAIRGLRSGSTQRPGSLIVAGADRLRRRHLERLADACDRHHVRLTYLFRHLRDDAEALLGSGGTAIFMRLGNHAEAERAARFIGHGHRFALTQVTAAHGGDRTNAGAETTGESAGTMRTPMQPGTTTKSRSWGVTSSYAEGTNWHYAETRQRVYEYAVEPSALQNLPDFALLAVTHGQGFDPHAEQLAGRPRVQVADCNPDIVSLPRVLTQPLPAADVPAFDPAAALERPATAPERSR